MFLKRSPVLVSTSFNHLNGCKLWFSSSIALVAALAFCPSSTLAQSSRLPSRTGLDFQTSAPGRGANIGDWYTTATSASTDRIHRFFINVTAADLAAAGGSIVITVDDAESNGARDEVDGQPIGTVGGTPDPTRFQLLNSAGTVIDSRIIPSGSADGTQINFPPITTPGTYTVTSVTGALPIFGDATANLNDDDNSFSISVPISGLLIGQFQGSFQRSSGPPVDTIPFFFLVGPGTNGLFLRNFDLDAGGGNPNVSYTSPNGTVTQGTTSGNALWNGGGSLDAGGDNVVVGGIANTGTWTLTLGNYNINNQTLLEVNDAAGNRLPVFDTLPTRAGNFTMTTDTTLTTKIGAEVCHPFSVTNNFFTTDIVNLTTTGTDSNYAAVLRNATNTDTLSDTDGDGVLDTGILQPGETRTFNLCVTPNPGATTPDTTRINGTSFMDRKIRQQANQPPATPQFVDKITSIPTEQADLSLTKTVSVSSPAAGSNITYTVTLRNDGPSTATNVSVLDQIPNGLTFISSTPSQGTYDATTGIWTVGTVNNAATATLQITVTVNTSNPITNTAQVNAADQTDVDSTPGNSVAGEDDQASVTIPFTGEPRLRLVKRITNVIRSGAPLGGVNFGTFIDDPTAVDTLPGWTALPTPGIVGQVVLDNQTPLLSGDQVEYTVYFLSDGNTAVTNAKICDLIPDGTTFDPNGFGSGQGIFLNTIGAQTNAPADDQGTFFSVLSPVNSPCANSNNPTGAVLMELGNVNPQQAGLVRFRVRIN